MSRAAFKVFAAVAVFALFSCASPPLSGDQSEEQSEESANLIKNGDFSSGVKFWSIWLSNASAQQLATESGEMEIRITRPGSYEYAVQPFFDGFSLYKGGVYKYSFDVRSTVERPFEWRLQVNGKDYHAYVGDWVTVGTQTVHVERVFTMEEATDFAPRLVLNVGFAKGCPEGLGSHSMFFDNFSLELVDSSGIKEIVTDKKTAKINLNQVGYLPEDQKVAIVKSKGKVKGGFAVVDALTGESVYSGKISRQRYNRASGEQTAQADFSALKVEGTFKVVAAGYGQSFEFKIAHGVYDELLASALRFFYLQRCGDDVADEEFSHPACHTQEAVVYGDTQSVRDVRGGWHDAGDYGRYVVPAAKAVCDLMLALECFPSAFGGSALDAITDEVQYELEWMIKMQDDSGALFHKVTCQSFPGAVMPQEEVDRLVLFPVSTTATADFAASMAVASRVFKDTPRGEVYLQAAQKAWQWLEATPPDTKGFVNPPLFDTGAYPDGNDTDERFWALAALYRITGDEKLLDALLEYDVSSAAWDFGWQQVGLYALYEVLQAAGSKDARFEAFQKRAQKAFLSRANEKLVNVASDSYGVSLGEYEYYWGSNMGVANNGMLFLLAHKITSDEKYAQAAKKQLDYILGTNTTSYCFVTGFGTLSPVLPHHRPSQVVMKPMAGMLVGGPDFKLEDPFARANLEDEPNAACYIDSVQSYSCNEVTIYWNSPLVFLLAGVSQWHRAS